MTILNLTQHTASPEQLAAGVVDLAGEERERLVRALTFDTLPSREEVVAAAQAVAALAVAADAHSAMIGGAPYLMAPLEAALDEAGIAALYAFSVRESVEQTQPDGSVRKINVFRHAGFIAAARAAN